MHPYINQGSQDTRSGFGAGLLELGRLNPKVVALCADLTGSLKMDAFAKEYPERFFQTGIAEAHMMSMAAGLTIGGWIPFKFVPPTRALPWAKTARRTKFLKTLG
jgi:transketolase